SSPRTVPARPGCPASAVRSGCTWTSAAAPPSWPWSTAVRSAGWPRSRPAAGCWPPTGAARGPAWADRPGWAAADWGWASCAPGGVLRPTDGGGAWTRVDESARLVAAELGLGVEPADLADLGVRC